MPHERGVSHRHQDNGMIEKGCLNGVRVIRLVGRPTYRANKNVISTYYCEHAGSLNLGEGHHNESHWRRLGLLRQATARAIDVRNAPLPVLSLNASVTFRSCRVRICMRVARGGRSGKEFNWWSRRGLWCVGRNLCMCVCVCVCDVPSFGHSRLTSTDVDVFRSSLAYER